MSGLNSILLMSSPQAGGQGSPFTSLVPLLLIMVVFYFFLIRPQMKRQKELKSFRESLKKGDRVVTAGGIYGKINNISEHAITIDVGNNVLLKVDKNSVLRDTTDVENQAQ
jgi:preprotein translocase subunit YajC